MATMAKVLRRLILALAALALALLLSFPLTFLLLPFWRWLESAHGIEAVGHSGPADWCFWLIFALLAVPAAVLAAAAPARQRAPP
jgi:hypothetical protein